MNVTCEIADGWLAFFFRDVTAEFQVKSKMRDLNALCRVGTLLIYCKLLEPRSVSYCLAVIFQLNSNPLSHRNTTNWPRNNKNWKNVSTKSRQIPPGRCRGGVSPGGGVGPVLVVWWGLPWWCGGISPGGGVGPVLVVWWGLPWWCGGISPGGGVGPVLVVWWGLPWWCGGFYAVVQKSLGASFLCFKPSWRFLSISSFAQWCVLVLTRPTDPGLAFRQFGVCQRHALDRAFPEALGPRRWLWVQRQSHDREKRLLVSSGRARRGTGHPAEHCGVARALQQDRYFM